MVENNVKQQPESPMQKVPWVLLALAVLSGLIGFIGFGSAIVDGLGKAMFGTFLILFFLFYLAQYKDL